MGAASQYFESDPAARSRPRTLRLTLPDLSVELTADRGVFAADAIDPGTKLLLLEAPRPLDEAGTHVLDLGCGYGPVAVALGRRAPKATVWAVDVNRRALDLCGRNAEAAGLHNVRVVGPDAVPPEIRFAGIWSNPPIRIGKAALHELLLGWLGRLAGDGAAWLVVHKHLGSDSLVRWLAGEGFAVERLRSRAGYRILEVRPVRP